MLQDCKYCKNEPPVNNTCYTVCGWGKYNYMYMCIPWRKSPFARSNSSTSASAVYRHHEQEKLWRAYEQCVREIEHGSFTPFVFFAFGGMGPLASYNRLADLLCEIFPTQKFCAYSVAVWVSPFFVQQFGVWEGLGLLRVVPASPLALTTLKWSWQRRSWLINCDITFFFYLLVSP